MEALPSAYDVQGDSLHEQDEIQKQDGHHAWDAREGRRHADNLEVPWNRLFSEKVGILNGIVLRGVMLGKSGRLEVVTYE
jgi:hypothetical protein